MRTIRNLFLAGLLVGGGLFLASCSSEKSVSQDDVEQEISTQLGDQTGATITGVSCPGDLTAEVDETMDCQVTTADQEVTVTVTVTSVDGDQANFDIEVTDDGSGGTTDTTAAG